MSPIHATRLGLILLAALAGCVTIQPRVGSTGGAPGTGSLGPSPGTAAIPDAESRPAVDQVCRSQPRPSGYIAITYMIAGEACPPNSDPENPYNGAVVERFTDRPVGSTMRMCADQGVPSGWVRDPGRTTGECPGARVRAGQPTTVTIRKAR